MAIKDRITIDADVMQGKPVIRGTRITVDLLLRKLSEGATQADLLDAYPHLTADDIRAALAYAADAVAHEDIVLTAPLGRHPALIRKPCASSPTRAVTSPSCVPSRCRP